MFQAPVDKRTAWEKGGCCQGRSPETFQPPSCVTSASLSPPPQVFHEQGILFGYRHPQSSATACLLSLFQMTNETLNIWTHLLPFWYLPAPLSSRLMQSLGTGASLNTAGVGQAEVPCWNVGDFPRGA